MKSITSVETSTVCTFTQASTIVIMSDTSKRTLLLRQGKDTVLLPTNQSELVELYDACRKLAAEMGATPNSSVRSEGRIG